jgi:nucleoside-diphosphate-sugar epimerase
MSPPDSDLVVAVTGPTGTLGSGLLPLLQADARVARVIGVARRPFHPEEYGWTKLEYRQGDVRDRATLEQACDGVDVLVHLAFLVTGTATRRTTWAVNVEGTLNAVRAAARAGARRFVYASSVAAYGFHPDSPVGMSEDWPIRPAAHLLYAREKADVERRLAAEAARHPELNMYVLRPSIVVGPHTLGAKDLLPGPLASLGRELAGGVRRLPIRLPAPVPQLPLQLVHEVDVGQALLLSIVGAGPPGSYNIAGDGILMGTDVARELGFIPVPLPGSLVRAPARALAALAEVPIVPPAAAWAEALSHPAIVDTSKAKRDLGWRPRYTGVEALRATLHPES